MVKGLLKAQTAVRLSGSAKADDKAQLAKRAAGMNMCRWCFHSFTETDSLQVD